MRYVTGELIEVERDGVWVPGQVELASPNGDSLAVCFDVTIGMALLRQPDGEFLDIITGRVHRVRHVSMPEATWFWLSFCDASKPKGSQFLGACIVGPAHTFLAAVALARAQGCNPGGEVAGAVIPPEIEPKIPATHRNRLLTRSEAEGMDALLGIN